MQGKPETQVRSLGGKIPWRRKWQPAPLFLPGESCGQRSLVGYSPQSHKESDTIERLNKAARVFSKSAEPLCLFFGDCEQEGTVSLTLHS